MKEFMVTRGKLSKETLAYIAGIIDGEGWITLYRSKNKDRRKYPRFEYQVGVSNNFETLIKWLYELFGGTLRTRYWEHERWQTNYMWKLSSNQASAFLKQIIPYMRIKVSQAKLAIEFQEKRKLKVNRFKPMTESEFEYAQHCWEQMKALNHTGR